MLRMVPLPRFAGEDQRHRRHTLDPPPFTGEGDHAQHGGGMHWLYVYKVDVLRATASFHAQIPLSSRILRALLRMGLFNKYRICCGQAFL